MAWRIWFRPKKLVLAAGGPQRKLAWPESWAGSKRARLVGFVRFGSVPRIYSYRTSVYTSQRERDWETENKYWAGMYSSVVLVYCIFVFKVLVTSHWAVYTTHPWVTAHSSKMLARIISSCLSQYEPKKGSFSFHVWYFNINLLDFHQL